MKLNRPLSRIGSFANADALKVHLETAHFEKYADHVRGILIRLLDLTMSLGNGWQWGMEQRRMESDLSSQRWRYAAHAGLLAGSLLGSKLCRKADRRRPCVSKMGTMH